MSDDERLQRLTELARRVWPEFAKRLATDTRRLHPEDRGTVRVRDGSLDMLVVHDHPRALDALEAALLVLNGDTTRADLRRLAAETRDVLQRELDGRNAWVEQLAAEYDERAALREELAGGARAEDRNQNAADLSMWASHYRNLAAELRARAKGGER